MHERENRPKENKSRAVANLVGQKESDVKQRFGFVDNRPQVSQFKAFQEMAYDNVPNIQLHNRSVNDNDVAQFTHYTSGDPVRMDDDDPTSELLDDNFDETIKDKLIQPTADGTVEDAVKNGTNSDVILWRSTTGASVAAIQAAGSAGGAAAKVDAAAPGHEEQQDQIAVGGVVPEYTASRGVTGFSWRHWLVVVRINSKYLARGSAAESGWICSPAAPVKVLDTVDRTLGLDEPPGFGAA